MRGQRGFALFDIALAAALAALIAAWTAGRLANQVDDAAAHSTGTWLLAVKGAMDQMVAASFEELAAGQAPLDEAGQPLYADFLAPGVAELRTHGHLPEGFPDRPVLGGAVSIRILRSAGCPGAACRLDALVHTERALTRSPSGPADFALVGQVMLATAGYGGAVQELAPQRVRGPLFDLANPLRSGEAPLAPGTVAVLSTLDTTMFQRFVRRHDLRDPELRGPLSVAGRISAGEYLQLGAQAVEGEPCPSAGLLGRDEPGLPLACRDGRWESLGGFQMRGPFVLTAGGPTARALGSHKVCMLSGNSVHHFRQAGGCELAGTQGGAWNLSLLADALVGSTVSCMAICLD